MRRLALAVPSEAVLSVLAVDVNRLTDVIGITLVLAAITLWVVADARRRAGDGSGRKSVIAAVILTVLAVAIIAGRFDWLRDTDAPTATAAPDETLVDDPPADDPSGPDGEGGPDSSPDATDTSPDSTAEPVIGPPTLPPVESTTSTSTTTSTEPPATTTTAPTTTTEPVPTTVDEPDVAEPPADGQIRGPPSDEYVVVVGDNFWDIAEAQLEAQAGGPVSDAEVIPYWTALIDANADQLAEPGNPDLILPGQSLVLPPLPA